MLCNVFPDYIKLGLRVKWSLTKEKRQLNGEMSVFSTNRAGTMDIHMPIMNLDSDLPSFTKIKKGSQI